MAIRRESWETSRLRSRLKRAAIALAALTLAAFLAIAFITLRPGNWAELELVSIQSAQDGQITAHFTVRYPSGGGVDFTAYVDGQPQSGGSIGGEGFLPFPQSDSKTIEFNLNPEHASIEGSFTNSALFRRLLVRVGERHRIGVGSPWYLYDFFVSKQRHAMIVTCKGDRSAAPQEQTVTAGQAVRFYKTLLEEAGKGNDQLVALDAARPSAPYLSDFVRLFPLAEVKYRNFGGGIGFDVEVDLHERYEFQMQLPVKFDSSRRSVTGYGEPRFCLREIVRVETRENRTGVSSYNPASERKFGSAEWKKIVESGGDFGVIGYPMITNRSVRDFKDRNIEK